MITDRLDATSSPAGGADSTTGTLSALDQDLDKSSVTRLREVLGLTHSGTVRLPERLAAAGLVTRGVGPAGGPAPCGSPFAATEPPGPRPTSGPPTSTPCSTVSPGARCEPCTTLLAQLMGQVVSIKDGGAWICLRCDLHACGRREGRCPAEKAAAKKYGPAVGEG